MNAREAFKVGFLSRCVEEGLGPEQICQRIKSASEKLALFSDITGALKNVMDAGTGAAKTGLPFLLAAPPIAGAAVGYAGAKATDLDDVDVTEIKKREVVEEYRRQIERLNRARQIREYRRQRQQTGRVF